MRALASGLVFLTLGLPLLAQSASQLDKVPRLDKGQGESVMRLVREGESARLFCKSCTDVVYSTMTVETRTLRPIGSKYELLLNDQLVDVNQVYVDSGYGDGWDNLGELIGFTPEGSTPKLSRGLDTVAQVVPLMGLYTGTLGEKPLRLELALEGRRVTGSLSVDGQESVNALLATSFNAIRERNTMGLVERDDKNNLAATLRGELDPETGTFTGTRSPLDGSSPESFQLTLADEAP